MKLGIHLFNVAMILTALLPTTVLVINYGFWVTLGIFAIASTVEFLAVLAVFLILNQRD